MSRKYQLSCNHWSQASCAQAVFRRITHSERKANMVARGDGKYGSGGRPQDLSPPKKKY